MRRMPIRPLPLLLLLLTVTRLLATDLVDDLGMPIMAIMLLGDTVDEFFIIMPPIMPPLLPPLLLPPLLPPPLPPLEPVLLLLLPPLAAVVGTEVVGSGKGVHCNRLVGATLGVLVGIDKDDLPLLIEDDILPPLDDDILPPPDLLPEAKTAVLVNKDVPLFDFRIMAPAMRRCERCKT